MAKQKVPKGTKVSGNCVDEARKKLSLFDEEDLHSFMNSVFDKAKTYEGLDRNTALRQALKDVQSDERAILLSRCAVKANNINKFESQSKAMLDKNFDLVNVVRKSSKNKGMNIESTQSAEEIDLKRFFFSDLADDAKEHFFRKANHRDIANAYDGLAHENKLSKVVADKLKEYFDYKKEKLVESNAMGIETLNEHRIFGNVFDRSKVISANTSLAQRAYKVATRQKVNPVDTNKFFIETVMPNLDKEETFKFTKAKHPDGSINEAEARKIVNNICNNFLEDKSDIFTRSVVANDREAVKKKSRMFFKWKDMNSYLNVSDKLGSGDLFQDFMMDLGQSANKIGMARVMGDSPDSMFNDLKKVQKEVFKQRDVSLSRQKFRERQAELLFNERKGTNKTAYDPTLANIGSSLRQLTSMSKLAFLPFQSLSDVTQGAGVVARHGFGFWETAFHNVKNIFNNPLMDSETRRFMAEMMKLDLDTAIGYRGKFVDAVDLGSAMSKMSNGFFYANLTHALDKGNKLGTVTMLARGYGRSAKNSFAELNEQTRYQWLAHNLTENEWETLRTKTVKVDGKDLFTLDSVTNLSKQELKDLWDSSDKSIPLSQYKASLSRNVYSLFDTAAEAAIVSPGSFERMVMSWGNIRPGTYSGEAVRMFMQFKGFPIGFIRRNMIEAWNDLQGPQRKMMYAVNMMLATFPLSYASAWLGYAARGLTMPSFEDMSGAERVGFLASMMAPGMGVFLSILSKNRQGQDMALNLLATPSTKVIGDTAALLKDILFLDPQSAGKDLTKAAKLLSPISSVPFVEPLMDKALGKTPYLQPGQEIRDWAQ